jgi:uncharacterized membrane protein YkoI
MRRGGLRTVRQVTWSACRFGACATGRARRMLAGGVAVCLAVVLAGCANTVEKGRQQVHTQVQTTHEEAVRAALDAVPSGRLAKLELEENQGAGSERNGSERDEPGESDGRNRHGGHDRHDGRDRHDQPEWHSEIVSEDGTRTSVTQSATGAEPATAKPAVRPDGTAGPRLRGLLRKAVVAPEDAVRKVAEPDYDKVDAVELTGSTGKPVWRIRLVAVEPGNAHVYEIDAATGDVLGRHHV